jgi:imidazolonepropionase
MATDRSYDADLVLWDLPHEHAIVQPWGAPKVRLTLRRGREIAPRAGS